MGFLDLIFGRKKESGPENRNSSLERAMHELALKECPENRKNVYQALLGAMLLIPVPEIPPGLDPGPGLHTTTTGVQLQFSVMLDRNHKRVAPAFTDAEALQNWDPNTPYIGIKAQEFFRLVMGTDIQAIMINPFDPIRKMIRPGGRVTRAELELLSKGIVPTQIGPKGVQFQLKSDEARYIGVPAKRPSVGLEASLREKASQVPEIAELYLFQMATKGSSHTVIGIVLDKIIDRTVEDQIAAALGEHIQLQIGKGKSLDFLILRGSFRDQVRATGILIFRR